MVEEALMFLLRIVKIFWSNSCTELEECFQLVRQKDGRKKNKFKVIKQECMVTIAIMQEERNKKQ